LPAPAIDESAPAPGTEETAVLGGGCFWGVQAVFQHLDGVKRAESGYAGGTARNAEYELVGTGRTGHAESVQIRYDPHVVSYGRILQVFFSVAHDPTQVNRQGPDVGSQYRSVIFAANDTQRRIASSYIAQLDKAGVFHRPIATQVSDFTGFYPAEAYHQDFATLHPDDGYIAFNDLPKIENLKRLYPQWYRAQPVLVTALVTSPGSAAK
jgi:peptide-methionine (S)-S-oxide reductase